jgi:hypothetical protein
MRTKKTGIIFAGCVIASLSSAPSHRVEAIEKGTSEIVFLFSYSRQTVTVEGTEVVDPIHSIVLSSTYGYFLTPMFEPSIGLGGSYMKQGSEDTMIIELMPGLLLNVTTLSDVLVPYVGGRIGFAYVDLGGGEVGFVWNLGGGLRYLVAKNVSFNLEVGYKQYILDTDGKTTRLDFIPVSAGISFLF